MSNRINNKGKFRSRANTSTLASAQKVPKPKSPPYTLDAKKGPVRPISTGNDSFCEKFPIQDRITHLLALKTYTKPELLLRLQKDGLQDIEKKLTSIFLKSCQLNASSYSLPKSSWGQVQDNWALYTPEEQDLVSKLKKQHLQDETSSSRKRTLPTSFEDESSNKRICIASSGLSDQDVYTSLFSGLSELSDPSPVASSNDMQKQMQANDESSKSSSSCEDSSDNEESAYKEDHSNQPPENNNRYTTITSQEQRARYMKDFEEVYDEHMSHHTFCSNVSAKFKVLKRRRHSHKLGSEERNKIGPEIKAAYQEALSQNFYNRLARFNELNEKMVHIKSLIAAYDNCQ